jgi:hypothetical protein
MRLVITEKQLRDIVRRRFPNQEIGEEEDVAAAAPEAGTSSDGDTKTGMSKWESGVTRGPANQIAVTRWKDIAGVTPARGKANPLWEQVTNPAIAIATNYALNPATDTPFEEKTTFWGEKYKIPTNGIVRVNIWDSKTPRASKFAGAHEISGVWYWDQKYFNPKTKKIDVVEELAPEEEVLADWFYDNTLRGIYVNKEERYYGAWLKRTNNEWKPMNGYYFNPGEGQNLIQYKPELYIHTSLTTEFLTWSKENWPLIAEVLVSIAVGIATGGASLLAQALIQAGVSLAFAGGVYYFSERTAEDQAGLAMGIAIAALPFIPAAINKFGLKGPLSGLAKYGDDLSRATTEDEIATIIARFPEAEQLIIKTAFKEIPKYEFEKVIANKAAQGFAKQVRSGKIDLGKLPAHKLKWWQELLIEGGGAIPVSVGVGYVFKTVQERKAAEQKVSLLSGELESKENTDALDKLTADAQRKKSEQQKQTPVTVPNKPAIDTQIKKTTIKTPETPVNKEEPVKKTIGLFGPTAPVSANDSTAIK